jgi:hypothetical protein
MIIGEYAASCAFTCELSHSLGPSNPWDATRRDAPGAVGNCAARVAGLLLLAHVQRHMLAAAFSRSLGSTLSAVHS